MKRLNNTYIIGDLNCQSYRLMMKIELKKLNNSHIIVLGNYGIGVLYQDIEKRNLSNINQKLKSNNSKIYLLKGDKDKDELYKKYKNKYSNIIFASDYQIININNINFMFVGGSVTHDRVFDFNHKRKTLNDFNEYEIRNIPNIDIVLSHENVDFIHPYNLHNLKPFTRLDKWLYNDTKKKKKSLSKLYETLKTKNHKIKSWYSSKHNINLIERKNFTNFIQLEKLNMVKL